MIYEQLPAVEEAEGIAPDAIPEWVLERQQPIVLRGLVKSWPALPEGEGTFDEMESYLSKFWNDRPVTAYVAGPEVKGRYGYNDAFNGFNFRSGQAPLKDILQRIREQLDGDEDPMSIYVGSTPVAAWLPGFLEANPLSVPGKPLINFWLGNRTTVSAHYDFPSNIACVVYGQRRFTLFPLDQIENLYIGPVDRTPSGQPISLVDFDNPDLERFPRFEEALAHGQTTVLNPGDAIFVPSMWWHHVKALSDCNLLVNYWWLKQPDVIDSPFGALLHGILSIRTLPEEQRRAWKLLMDHYVFDVDPESTEHIPEQALGCLGERTQETTEQLRAAVLKRLNV